MTSRKKYTVKQLDFLRAGYLRMNVRDLTAVFNKHFGTQKTEAAISSILNNHRIRCGRKHKDRLIATRLRIYTEEQAQFIRDNYTGRSVKEMTVLFNRRFETHKTAKQIRSFCHNRGLISGCTGQFRKGHRPWNYGTKGQGLMGPNSGSFKKGNMPPNKKPLWHERIDSRDGYLLMKVPERNPYTGCRTRYKSKHVYKWEQEHGPVPEGHCLLFIDGDKTNIKLENLMLVSRNELLQLNKVGYSDAPDDVKPSVLALSKLKMKIFEKRYDGGDGI